MRAKREGVSSLLALFFSLLALPSSLLASSLLALPTGYTQLDELEFNGSQWIETGCCPAAGDRFECDVTVDAVQPNASAAVFGTVRESEPERTFAFYVRQDGDDSTVVAYGDTARGGFFPRGKRVTLSVGSDGAMWEWEGGSGRLELTPGFARNGVTPLLIGNANAARLEGDSVPAGTGAVMKLHRFRIWRGGLELLHDYVPCTDPAGRYGVFDEVDRKFLLRRQEIGFFVNGRDVGCGEGTGWSFEEGVLALTNATTYVLSGAATNDEVRVKATDEAKVVLSDMVVFTSKRPAIDVKQSNLTVAANQVLKTGDTPEALRYARSCNGERCVLAAPGVTVTVKDIPHVTGFTVSNAVETIMNAARAATCRMMAGDDVYVGYAVEKGYFSKSPNPLVYPSVTSDVTVDAGTIEILPCLPYRAWNGATWRMVDCVCSNYTVVATNTATFADGQWYAVTGTVSCGTITVSGSAHLILCDDAKLTAEGGEKQAGVKVEEGRSLAIYGQKLGTGEFVTRGGRLGAGIGGSYGRDCGMVTIHGGTVTADGGNESAGIGGGDFGAGGTVTVNGGTVTATGGFDGPGIGGGYQANGSGRVAVNGGRVTATGGRYGAGIGGGNLTGGGEVTVNGGTVTANGGEEAQDIGQGRYAGDGNWTLVFDGGSVRAARLAKGLAKNSTPTNVYCVTVKLSEEGRAGSEEGRAKRLAVEGLGGYGTNDIYAVKNDKGEGCVYLWLPDGTHRFTVSDGTTTNRYRAIVKGEGITTEPLPTYGFHVNGVDVGDGSDTGWSYTNGVLSLTNAMTYVLSGVATNNEVQVRADAAGATVVMSNVAVFASGAPAFVKVQGASLSVAANQVMKTGQTPEALRYAQAYNGERCVRAAPGVTVTVKDIPHVTGFTVSNAVEVITNAARAATCRVMAGDDVFVGYTVEADCTSQAPNPLVYTAVESSVVVDANTIRILKNIPYRAWNAEKRQMEDCVCSNYTVVATNTQTFADGQWYAVTGTVSCGTITVSGSAHLILCDDAKMTAKGEGQLVVDDQPGILIEVGNSLSVYGQSGGTGTLTARGGYGCAGIGGDDERAGDLIVDGGIVSAVGNGSGAGIGGGYQGAGGTVTVNGGTVTATGGDLGSTIGNFGAGIGGGYQGSGGTVTVNGGTVTARGVKWAAGIGGGDGGSGGTVTVNGGRVTATGGQFGAGIGGGSGGSGGTVTIGGGTVTAEGGADAADIGGGVTEMNNGALTIDGGSVKAARVAKGLAKNSTPTNVYCVTVKVGGLKVEGFNVEGLCNYGTNDIYAIDSRVYLWLPDGTHRFTVSDGATTNRYCAVVHGRGVTVEPLGPIGFFVNGEDIGDTGSGAGWNYNKNMKNLTLSEVGLYVLSGVAMNDEVHIHVAGEKAAGATVILSNAVVFVSGQPPALNVDQNILLLMAGGSSFLGATNNVMAISVGPKAALTVGLAPGADETEAIIGVFNYGDVAAIGGAGSVTVRGGTLAVWADKRAAETPINRTADVFCMLAGNDPETAKVVDTYNGELYVLVTAAIAPVTPGKPFGSFTTAEAATNVMKKAVLVPRDDVAKVLISEGLRRTYCDMFALAVTGGDESWFVEALLTPEARTNLAETATAATRQIPVAAIARLSDVSAIAQLPEDVTTNVTVNGCAPGFFYSLYDGWALTNIVADANATNLNVLCGADAKVVFPEVKKPSDAAGFFKVGVGVTDNVGK